MSLGYTDVFCFRGGLPEWIRAGYPVETIEKLPKADVPDLTPAELDRLLGEKADLLLLDLRPDSEAAKYWLASPRTVSIPFDELGERIGEVPTGSPVVVLDVNGKRSPIAARFLVAKGFDGVSKVAGGMERWLKDGHSVEKAK